MRLVISSLLLFCFLSCHNRDAAPDVDHIKTDLTTERFEQKLFALDTNQLATQLPGLLAADPAFAEIFMDHILNVDPKWPADSAMGYIRGFLTSHRAVYDSAQLLFKNFSPYEKQIKKGLQYVKYYFPAYKIPRRLITYIGPLNGYGDILDDDVLIIGLQHHLGGNYSLYKTEWVQEAYPDYISRRFEPDYIAINSMKNIVNDLYPEKTEDKSLLIQMVEKGKRLYLLNRFLPGTEEYKLIGYTQKQYNESIGHEASIWDLFVQNNFLQTIDYGIIKNYVGEGPKTQELGDASPGNIGSFSGWRIVKKYMEKFPETTLPQLMEMDADKLFSAAKYKP
ncbi:MAG: hypothetical protein JWQ27_999 [Ferruginibacter sp.]|nr:hypothetical protein [Ferruginibacter sp.]